MEECYNCHQLKELQNSHIIPEFFYKYVYTQDHKFILLSEQKEEKLIPEQKGFREKLLCHECEELLSKKETVASFFFNDLITKNYSHIHTFQLNDKILVVENYDMTL